MKTGTKIFDVHAKICVEALSIIHQLLGDDPSKEEVQKIQRAIEKSYDLYLLALDEGMEMRPYLSSIQAA